MADYPGYDAFCRECGKPIIFIRTPKGKLMPCDAQPVKYWRAEPGQGVLIYQRSGRSERGVLTGLPSLCAGSGYRPHWASCTERRRSPAPPAERPESPLQKAIRERVQRELAAKREREERARAKAERERELREAEARQLSLFGGRS